MPLYYNAKPSAGWGYLFAGTAPLFPFGHRFFDIAMREVVEPGLFDIAVGDSSIAAKNATPEIA